MPAGRPPYIPTPEHRAMVQNLAAAGVDQDRISDCLGIGHTTLRKFYKTEIAIAKTQVTAMAQSGLVAAIKRNELGAICFWLKTREGWHETDAHRLVDASGNDRDVTVRVIYEDLPAKATAPASGATPGACGA